MVKGFLWTTEVLFIIDFAVNFVIVPEIMKKPTFKKTAKAYLKGFFIIDFIATIVSNVLFLFYMEHEHSIDWDLRLKLLRVLHWGYIRFAYKGITNCINGERSSKKIFAFVVSTIINWIFWLHIMTCIWIKLGSHDKLNDRWLTLDQESETTWMFIPGTDFSSDPRTIYEQVIDSNSNMGLKSLYLYALYWVLTVVSTVGYGHARYSTSQELLYACFLEIVATINDAYMIMVLRTLGKVK